MLNFNLMQKFTIVFTLLFLLSCNTHKNKNILNSKSNYQHLVTLETYVSDARVDVYSFFDNKLIFTTKTTNHGEWNFDAASDSNNSLVKIIAKNGSYKDELFAGSLCIYATIDDLYRKNITLNEISTLLCSEVDVSMTSDDIELLFKKYPLVSDTLSYQLYKADILDVFLNALPWEVWKQQDSDADTLTNWQELEQGLNPSSVDSDHDTLADNDELTLYHTKANSSDSDNDFIPDNIELEQNTNPNNGDENENHIADGLEGDPFFAYQWYIYSDKNSTMTTTSNLHTIRGVDLDILELYHRTLGDNNGAIIVQVVDGGVDSKHEDLDISLVHSINSINNSSDPSPTQGLSSNPTQIFFRGHGTAVAGIVGAKCFNERGIRGVAPKVKIAGSNWLESEDMGSLDKVWYSGPFANEIAISNNSWGAKYVDDKSYEVIMQSASEELRDKKGRIFVFASGNDRKTHSNANLSYLINNPYAITVSALNHKNTYASYSTSGSNVLVCAYGGEKYYTAPTIMTTFSSGLAMTKEELHGRKGPLTIEEDIEKNYTFAMNGTSAAAPMVSGALALVLDLCPKLTWRDIRMLIAKTSTKIDADNVEWVKNSAGLWHNNNYGFGRINTIQMANECLSPTFKSLSTSFTNTVDKVLNKEIPDNNQSIDEYLTIEDDLVIEWVGLTLTIDHDYAGDLDIELISPAGTTSHIMTPNFLKSNAYIDGFRFSTVALMGEKSKGRWHIRIRDALKDDKGKLLAISLEIKGFKP